MSEQSISPARNYNPASNVNSGHAPKIWELLRLNPEFRRQATHLVTSSQKSGSGLSRGATPADHLVELDHSNPLAAYAMRWLFTPQFLKLDDLDRLFGFDSNPEPKPLLTPEADDKAKEARDRISCLFPYLEEEEISEIVWEWNEISKRVPLCTLRHHETFAVENLKKVLGPDFSLGPILDERDRAQYEGPLKISDGGFTLDTPWCDAPELFRKHFAWLWCHYDFSAESPFTSDRKFLPRPQDAMWLVNQIAEQPYYQYKADKALAERISFFYQNCDVFAFPKLLYPNHSVVDALKDMEKRLHSTISSIRKRIVSKAKFKYLMGTEAEWQIFLFCHPRVDYHLKNEDQAGPSIGSDYKAVEDEIAAAVKAWNKMDLKKRRENAGATQRMKKDQTHLTRRYRKMEALMFSVFPVLDIEALVKHSLS